MSTGLVEFQSGDDETLWDPRWNRRRTAAPQGHCDRTGTPEIPHGSGKSLMKLKLNLWQKRKPRSHARKVKPWWRSIGKCRQKMLTVIKRLKWIKFLMEKRMYTAWGCSFLRAQLCTSFLKHLFCWKDIFKNCFIAESWCSACCTAGIRTSCSQLRNVVSPRSSLRPTLLSWRTGTSWESTLCSGGGNFHSSHWYRLKREMEYLTLRAAHSAATVSSPYGMCDPGGFWREEEVPGW